MMTKVTLHFTIRQVAALKRLSQSTGLAVAELIRRAIDAYLKETKNEEV